MFSKDYPFIKNMFNSFDKSSSDYQLIKTCLNIAGNFIVGIDINNKIFFANKRALHILDQSEESFLNQNFESLIRREKDKNKFHLLMQTVFKKEDHKRSVNKTVELTAKSGDSVFIEMNLFPLSDTSENLKGFIISGENITDHIKIERLLKDSINNYRLLAGNIPDIDMFLFDTDLRFIIAEGSEMKKMNRTHDFYEGKTAYEVFDKETKDTLLPIFYGVLAGNELNIEYSLKEMNYIGTILPIRDENDEVKGGMAIIQNITREKRIAKNIKNEKEKAEKANQTKSEFLANISHEIRTPLNAIIGFSEQISQTELNEKQRNFINIIEKSSNHLLSLVNDILVISKIEAGELQFVKTGFYLAKIVEDVYSTLWIKAEQKDINFSYEVDERLDHYIVVGDSFRLKQVLINILSNAIKFTQHGFVLITSKLISKQSNKLIVQFEISDSGIGIPEEKLQTIFDQFKQADSTITKKFGGTGLGLTISKSIIETMHGEIDVKSKPGKGTSFYIKVPFEIGTKDDMTEDDNQHIKFETFDGLKVLIVDDDSVNRLLGLTILEKLNVNVEIATNGREAIEKLSNHNYDILLLDIHMPEVSGMEVAKFIREEQKDYSTKIIAVTASFMKEGVEKYFRVGINDYVIKPYTEFTIFNKISKVLGKKTIISKTDKSEDILNKQIKNSAFFDLTELKQMSNNDQTFINKMLNTFITNSKAGLRSFSVHKQTSNWEGIGEIAHKLLPSYRHLRVHNVEQDLLLLKEKTIIEPEYDRVPEILERVEKNMHMLLKKLEKEIL